MQRPRLQRQLSAGGPRRCATQNARLDDDGDQSITDGASGGEAESSGREPEDGASGASVSGPCAAPTVTLATYNASGWRALQAYLEVIGAIVVVAQETHVADGDDMARAFAWC